MDDALAQKRLSGVLDLFDRYGDTYDRRWGKCGNVNDAALDAQLHELEDEVPAAALWDNGHFRQAVQTAGTALEGLIRVEGSAKNGIESVKKNAADAAVVDLTG
jgi:hypothetical protein